MIELFQQFNLLAALDILIIAVIIYYLLMLIRGTRAAQMMTGILIIFIAFLLLTKIYRLPTLEWLMNKFYSSIIIFLVIIFQEDIRRVLSRVGKKPILPSQETLSPTHIVDEIIRAATALAGKKIGALIVFERQIILNRYVDIGILLDARVSKEIILSIFHPTSPIHDGAVIIQQGRIAAAGCFLPLTREENIDPNLGTRHRAAIGISQETDAVVVIVSEEIGVTSLVVDGKVQRFSDTNELRKILKTLLNHMVEDQENESISESTNQENLKQNTNHRINKFVNIIKNAIGFRR